MDCLNLQYGMNAYSRLPTAFPMRTKAIGIAWPRSQASKLLTASPAVAIEVSENYRSLTIAKVGPLKTGSLTFTFTAHQPGHHHQRS